MSAQYTGDIRNVARDYKAISVTVDNTSPPQAANVVDFTKVLGRPARKIVFQTTDVDDSVTIKINPYAKAVKRHKERVDETVLLPQNNIPDLTLTITDDSPRREVVFEDCLVQNLSVQAAVVGGAGVAAINIFVV